MNVCQWKLYDIESNQWDSGCGKRHAMGWRRTPKQAGMKVCPYCGDKLITNTTGWVDGWDKYDPSTWTPAQKEELRKDQLNKKTRGSSTRYCK